MSVSVRPGRRKSATARSFWLTAGPVRYDGIAGVAVGEGSVWCARVASRRFPTWVSVYVGVVEVLLVVSFLAQDSIAAVLYLTAAALTLPAGTVIYPALWVAAFAVGASVHSFHLGENADRVLTLIGVAAIFAMAAVGNALLIRELWRARRYFRAAPR
jgi:hypothetical protein